MAFPRYFLGEWNRVPTSATDSDKPSTCFDCNICLDFARDPVVTLCGHLYCWPCIYKWVNTQTASLPAGQLPQCPVCKAETSENTMIPLYGRGQPSSEQEHQRNDTIPPRPPASGLLGLVDLSNSAGEHSENPYESAQNYGNRYVHDGYLEPHFATPSTMSHPLVGMLGEMVYTRVFGNTGSLYTYPNSYHSAGSSTPRLRRREMEADRSLSRVCIFLFCCFIWCLLLF